MGETTLIKALEEFKMVYLPARNLAARTQEEYANDLKDLFAFLTRSGVTKVGEFCAPCK
jgi:hypothetical protein